MKFVESGKIEQVGDNLSSMIKAMRTKHPLYPHYGYDMQNRNGEMISIPLLEDARLKFSPRFDILANYVRVGSKEISELPSKKIFS